jgi:uncharacterized membrane protein
MRCLGSFWSFCLDRLAVSGHLCILRHTETLEIITGRSALQILDKRYTQGEICSEEYLWMKVDLKRKGETQ